MRGGLARALTRRRARRLGRRRANCAHLRTCGVASVVYGARKKAEAGSFGVYLQGSAPATSGAWRLVHLTRAREQAPISFRASFRSCLVLFYTLLHRAF